MKNVMNRALVAEKKLVLIVAAVVMAAGALTLSSCNPVEPEKKGDLLSQKVTISIISLNTKFNNFLAYSNILCKYCITVISCKSRI